MDKKSKQIVKGSIEFLKAEHILPGEADIIWNFKDSYVAPDNSVIILADTHFFKYPKVNIEINFEGEVFDRLAGRGEDGRGVRRYTDRHYFDFMKKYLQEQKHNEGREK